MITSAAKRVRLPFINLNTFGLCAFNQSWDLVVVGKCTLLLSDVRYDKGGDVQKWKGMNVFREISKTHSLSDKRQHFDCTRNARRVWIKFDGSLQTSRPLSPLSIPALLWSAVSELGSQQVSWQKGQKKVSVLGEKNTLLEKKAHCCCLRETRVEKQLQFDKYSWAKEGSLIRGQKQFLIWSFTRREKAEKNYFAERWISSMSRNLFESQ